MCKFMHVLMKKINTNYKKLHDIESTFTLVCINGIIILLYNNVKYKSKLYLNLYYTFYIVNI